MLERWRKRHLDAVGDYFSDLERPAAPPQVEKSRSNTQRNSNLRMVLSGGAPGMWASDHYQESLHCTGWNFAAVHAFAIQFAMAHVAVYGRRSRKSQRAREPFPDDPIDALQKRLDRLTSKSIQTENQTQDAQERIPLDHDHPLVALMRRPNPDQSGTQFRYQMAQQLGLTGGALVWTLRDKRTKYDRRGTPREQYIIPTGLAQPQAPSARYPYGWYRVLPMAVFGINLDPDGFAPGGTMGSLLVNGGEIDKREVRGIGWPHPLYVNDWLSSLSAGALQTDTIEEMERSIVARFRNEGRPGLIFGWESIDIWGSVAKEEKDAFRDDVRARNSGTHNTGNDLIKPPGMTVESFDNNPREMDYTGSIPLARNNVLAMHQTPQTVVGLNDVISYAALFASLKQYVELKVTPNLVMAFEEIGEEVCPAYGPGHSLEAKARSIDDPALHGQKMDRLQTRGLVTIDEARADEGKPPHTDPEYGKLPSGTTWQAWQQVKQAAEQQKQQAEQAKQQAAQGGGGGNPLEALMGGGDGGQGGGQPGGTADKPGQPTDTATGTRQEFRDAPDGRSDAMGAKAADLVGKSIDDYSVEKAIAKLDKLPMKPQDRKDSVEWLNQHADQQRRIEAAMLAFYILFMEDLKRRATRLLEEGRDLTPENIVQLIDPQIVAANLRDAVLPAMVQAAIAGARLEWDKHAPVGADFGPVAFEAEEKAKKKADFPYWLLLAGLLMQRAANVAERLPKPRFGEIPKPVDRANEFGERMESGNRASARSAAVTEATSFTGSGQDVGRAGLVTLGLLVTKQWVSMEDDHVRLTHRAAHGQVVPIGGKFTVGGYLCDYPADPSLPVHERAGCRCHALTAVTPSRPGAAVAKSAGDFDEAKHPRAADGKFGSGGSSDSGQAHDHANAVDSWESHEQNTHIDAPKRQAIAKALKSAIAGMPEPMAKIAVAGMDKPPQFYPTIEAVGEKAKQFGGIDLQEGERVSGIYSKAERSIHIDYGDDHDDAVWTHAHELGHVVDFADGPIPLSADKAWKSAWRHEIDRIGGPLSEYARTSAQEGFAEYVRALVMWPEEAKSYFPRCYAFLHAQGLT